VAEEKETRGMAEEDEEQWRRRKTRSGGGGDVLSIRGRHYPRSGHHCRLKNPLHFRILNRQWHTSSDGGLTSLPVLKNRH